MYSEDCSRAPGAAGHSDLTKPGWLSLGVWVVWGGGGACPGFLLLPVWVLLNPHSDTRNVPSVLFCFCHCLQKASNEILDCSSEGTSPSCSGEQATAASRRASTSSSGDLLLARSAHPHGSFCSRARGAHVLPAPSPCQVMHSPLP